MATGVLISSFPYVGVPTLSAVFGFFKTSAGTQIQRIQIAAQTPPVGGDITVQLVDGSGAAYAGATVVLPSGMAYYDQPLAAPITLGLGAIVRAQITGVDTGVAADLVVNLIGATVQGATAPSGCGPTNCQPPQAQLLFFQGSVQNEVAAAKEAQAKAETAAAFAAASEANAKTSETAAETAETGAQTAEANAAAQVALASGWATNANNAATASGVYAAQALASSNSAHASFLLAQGAANEAQSGVKAATLQLTPGSVQTIPDATPTAVQWNNAMFDDLVFFAPANPTRLTIPTGAGIERVRVSAGIRWTASAVGNRSLKIRANPVGMYSANTIVGSDERKTGATGDLQVQTAILTVEDGMYFEVIAEQDSGGGLDINTATAALNVANFFTIEVLKRTA